MKRRRIHFAAHGQWTHSWTFLMEINERGINETINDMIDEAIVRERQTKCFAYRRVYYSAVVIHFFYFSIYFAMLCKPSKTYSPP